MSHRNVNPQYLYNIVHGFTSDIRWRNLLLIYNYNVVWQHHWLVRNLSMLTEKVTLNRLISDYDSNRSWYQVIRFWPLSILMMNCRAVGFVNNLVIMLSIIGRPIVNEIIWRTLMMQVVSIITFWDDWFACIYTAVAWWSSYWYEF